MAKERWTTEAYLLLSQPESGQFLTRGGQLPRVELDGQEWMENIGPLDTLLKGQLGQVNILRCLYFHSDKATQRHQALYELEALTEIEGAWLKAEEILSLDLPAEVLGAIEKYLHTPESPLRAGWSKAGWLGQAKAWIECELSALGYRVGAIHTLKNWGISCVLRIPTQRETVYFKASLLPQGADSLLPAPLFCHEPLVTQALAQRFPQNFPKVLALQAQQGWMLSADFGQAKGETGLEEWQAMLRTYASIQKSLVGQADWLLGIGCLDRRLPRLGTQFAALLEGLVPAAYLSPEEVQQLQQLAPALLGACDRVAALGVPETLVHGDLHSGNFLLGSEHPVFFDWTDACVAHPFFDLPFMVGRLPESLGQDAKERLTQAYLECWGEYCSPEILEAQLPLIRQVGRLHQAVTYWRIHAGLEPLVQHEMEMMVPALLRRILQEAPNAGLEM